MYASVRGAGLLAAMSLDRLSLDDVRGLVRIDRVFEPDRDARSVYEPMYAEFKGFYGALHGSYSRLNGGLRAR
jgi:hypothetical protein